MRYQKPEFVEIKMDQRLQRHAVLDDAALESALERYGDRDCDERKSPESVSR